MQVDAQTSCVGFIEPFLYSKDRRNLLNTLVEDTEDRLYYTLIQLDNEIEAALKSSPKDDTKISTLLKEFDALDDKIKNTKSLKNSSKLQQLITRNHLRFIEYNDERAKKGWKIIQDKLSWYPSHKKPKKKRLAQSHDDVQYDSNIDCLGIDAKLLEKFKDTIRHSSSLTSHFEYNAIHYLTADDKMGSLTPYLISQILSWNTAIYIDQDKLFKLIQIDFKKNKVSFGSRNIHNKLTLSQLNRLYELNIDSLSSNKNFLQSILDKSTPKYLMRYTSFDEYSTYAPRAYKIQYHEIIKNFIIKHLTLPIHQHYKCALLHYLIQQQYDADGTFDADLLIEYLRIPKRRSWNNKPWSYYDSYNKRYNEQQKKLKQQKLSTIKPDTNPNDEGEADKALNKTLLDKIEYIGSAISDKAVPNRISFGPFKSDDGQQLIKKALKYFFGNTEQMCDALSEQCKEAVKEDTNTLKRLEKEYKIYQKQQKKKLLSELQQKQLRTQRLQEPNWQQQSNYNAFVQQTNVNYKQMEMKQENEDWATFEQDDEDDEDEEEDMEDDYSDSDEVQMYTNNANDLVLPDLVGDLLGFNVSQPPKEEKEQKEMEFIDAKSVVVVKYFLPYISREFLLSEQSEFELLTGSDVTQSQSYRSLMKLKSSKYVEELKDRVIIKYDKFKNKRKYNIADDVILTVTLKNVKKLLLKVFKMNTTPYFKKNKSELASDLNLEGLSSKTVDKEIMIDIKNEFQVQDLKIPLPSLSGKRGLYFVDVIGNGTHSRAIVRKGDFKYVERRSVAGHVLRLLDENHNVINKGNVWIDGKTYPSNDKGDIYIPYSSSVGPQKIICSSPSWDGYSVLAELMRKSEVFKLYTSFYVDRESLLEKQEAVVIVKNALFINSCAVSLKLLKSVTLDLSITSLQGVTVQKKFNKFKITDLEDATASFALPNNPRNIKFTLKCKVKKNDGSYQNFEKSQSFSINSIDTGKGIATAHLVPQKNGSYIVYILGKNGEALPNVVCSMNYKFFQLKSSLSKTAQSDKNGMIILPNMNGVKSLSLSCASHTESFSFPLNRCLSPKKIHIEQHKAFEIAYFSQNNIYEKDVNWKLFDAKYAADYSDKIEYNNGLFVCNDGLSAGSYILHADYHQYQCTIFVAKSDNVITMHRTKHSIENESETFTVLSNHTPLQIMNIDQESSKDKIKIKINGGDINHNRVHIFLSHKYAAFPIFNRLKNIPYCGTEMVDFNSAPSVYTSQRTISEEYRYVLERVSAKKYIGNMLAKPTLLLRPWSSRATKTQTQDAAKGDKIEHKTYRKRRRPQEASLISHSGSSMNESGSYSNLEFLAKSPSKALINLKVDKGGLLSIDKSLIDDNHTFMTVIASDNDSWCIRSTALKNKSINYKYSEVRLFPGLDINKHFTEQREIVLLFGKDDVFKIKNFKNSQCEVYVTLQDVFSLYSTSSKNSTLEQFSFLLIWHTLSMDKKLKKLNNFFCHETNFYLYSKYKEFFNDKIRPFLENKMEKTFMDHWLLNDKEKLFEYSSFGEFSKLNALEQILLAFTFKNDKERNYITHQTLQYFKDKNKSQKISEKQLQQLFKTALADRHYAESMKRMDKKQKEDSKERRRKEQVMSRTNDLMSDTSNFDNMFIRETPTTNYAFAQQQMQQEQMQQMAQYQQVAQMANIMTQRNNNNNNNNNNRMRRRMGQQRPQRRLSVESRRRPQPSVSVSSYNAAPSVSSSITSGTDKKQDDDDDSDDEEDADPFDLDLRYREIGTSFFKEMENTKEYQECHYYKTAWNTSTSHLVPANKFWCDYAEYLLGNDENILKPFLSSHFFLANSCFSEMIFALSVLDLPIYSLQNAMKEKNLDTLEMIVSCINPSIVFSQQLKETEISSSSTIHVAVHFFDPDDSHAYIDGERVDKFVDSFEPTKIYGCRAIITNSSSAQQNVEVLYQIPTGSIPVRKGLSTKTEFISIGSYSGKNLEFYFYFAIPGSFSMFPVQVSKKGRVLGFGKTKQLNVSYFVESKEIDKSSWDEVSIGGDTKDVIHYLNNDNLYDTSLSRIYWRLNDNTFFKSLTHLLRSKRFYDESIWKYAIKHRALNELSEIIERKNSFVSYFNPSFYSSWFVYDSIKNKKYCYLEYYPLINARSHQLGKKRRINNSRFKAQYTLFLQHSVFGGTDITSLPIHILLQSVYYLILQDRIDESIEIFRLIHVENEYHVQYDYLMAYLNIYDEKDNSMKIARNVVAKYKKIEYLSENKKKLIADIESQINELQLDDDDDKEDDDEEDLQDEEEEISEKERIQRLIQPSIDFEIRDRNIQFSYHKIKKVLINFYKMDIELLFSMSPFLRSNNDIFSYIEPNETLIVDLPSDLKLYNVAIPSSLQHENMYISATSMDPIDITSPISRAFYDHQLIVEIKDRFGILRVLDREQWINVQKAYIKVYALVNDEAKFHKDGYTDRRGQFDYVSVSCQHLTKTKKFAILIATKKYGSMVKIVGIPQDLITKSQSQLDSGGKPAHYEKKSQKRGFTKRKVRKK